jgi:hypothetical protein
VQGRTNSSFLIFFRDSEHPGRFGLIEIWSRGREWFEKVNGVSIGQQFKRDDLSERWNVSNGENRTN